MMANPHVLIEGAAIAAYAIRAKHAFIYVRGEVLHVVRRLRHAVEEAYAAGYLGHGHPRLRVRPGRHRARRGRRLHLRRGIGAAHLAGGLPRPAQAPAAVPGRGGPVRLPDGYQQRGVDRQRAVDRGQRRGLVRRARHGEVQGIRDLLAVRARHHARSVRGAARRHAARTARPGRRGAGRPPAEVLDPGRLVDPAADRRASRRAAGLRVGRRRRIHARHPGAADLRRDHLRGPRGAPLDRVLRARVVRQVHAVPRGDVLDGQGARTAGTWPRHRGRPGETPGHLRQHPRPRVLRPRRRRDQPDHLGHPVLQG